MSLREVPSSRPLLARKGAASPVSLRTVKGEPVEPSLRAIEGSGETAPEPAKLETSADLKASAAGDRASDSSPAASLLPFNLLRNKYRPGISPDLAEDEPDMVVGELAPAESEAVDRFESVPENPLPTPTSEPVAPPTLKTDPAAQPMLDFPASAEPRLRAEPRVGAPGQVSTPGPAVASSMASSMASAVAAASVPVPTPDPDWRFATSAHATAAPKNPSGGGWLLPFGALAAAFAALVVGSSMTNQPLEPTAPPAMDTPVAALPRPPAPQAPAPQAPAPQAPVSQDPAQLATGGTTDQAAAPVAVEPPPVADASPPPASSPVEAKMPQPALAAAPETAASADQVPDQPASTATTPPQNAALEKASAAAPDKLSPGASVPSPSVVAPVVTKPTVDVVRLEANGEAVIAGRAAPNSELIVLDNGKPIGTARADAFGEWVFVPETALPTGDHEFGLVLKTVQDSVSLPAPGKPALPPAPAAEPAAAAPDTAVEAPKIPESAPSPGATSATETSPVPAAADTAAGDRAPAGVTAPIPLRRPVVEELGAAPRTPADTAMADAHSAAANADFVVQLASVKTRDGAQQEWRKLQQRFPDILADMVPALDEVKLADYGTVVRVRTGTFNSQREAANLCARLESKNQECLVVRVSAGN